MESYLVLICTTITHNFIRVLGKLQTRAKSFLWLNMMLHHRADPTNAMVGGDNSKNKSF